MISVAELDIIIIILIKYFLYNLLFIHNSSELIKYIFFTTYYFNFTLSNDSAFAKTIKANPRDRPVLGSVLTLMLSISPYVPK